MFIVPTEPVRSRGRRMRRLAMAVVPLVAASVLIVAPETARAGTTQNDPAVISEWNAITVNTLLNDPTKAPQEDALYGAFVQAAVYNAVDGIHHEYASYRFDVRPTRPASAQAAAVAAAHEVLVNYVPAARPALDASYAASLSAMRDNAAKANGIAYGIRAADSLIAARVNDGRNAPVMFTQPPAPGVWRPTPPAFAPMAVPWMGGVTPLLVPRVTAFDPGPPPALTSTQYATDFNETKSLGGLTGSSRTADQTATALFFSGNAFVQYNAALRDQAATRQLDIVDAARMFAAVTMSMADDTIGVWYVKFKYGFWRPITAINLADTDGNDATAADPTWVPMITTPPYPDYVSGYCGLTGAFSESLADVFNTTHIDVTLTSTAVSGTRFYDSPTALRTDVINARVWLGIHFRTADTRGVTLGQQVADYALSHYFQPAS